VLPVLLFAALWVVVGLGVFFIGVRGGPSHAVGPSPRRRSYAARLAMGWTVASVFVGFGIVLPTVFLIGNHNRSDAQVGGIRLTASEKNGRQIFGQRCAVCHTLAAANAVGKVGPNLDVIQPTEQLVLHTIENGCLQSPPPGSQEACLGYGTMPADVVQGPDAVDVAKFVAAVAGKE
jgi:mono/diheme cytochrome c family protein